MGKHNNIHYVNNADFSAAVVEYVKSLNVAKEQGNPEPMVTNYIAECFMKISEGLSQKSNFVRYTYREEMVMDAVENCLKAIKNYDIDAATRTGKPNAFAYFTQIAWYAFLRRISKEKKQQELKLKYLSESGLEDFIIDANEDPETAKIVQSFVDNLKKKLDDNKEKETIVDEPKIQRRRTRSADSDLMSFFDIVDEE